MNHLSHLSDAIPIALLDQTMAEPNWLVGSSSVAAVLAIAAWSVNRFAKRPAVAHVLWVLVLLKLLTPPVFSVSIPVPMSAWAGQGQKSIPIGVDRSGMHGIQAAIVNRPDLHELTSSRPGLLWASVWAAGSLVMLLWVVRASRRVNRLIEQRGRFDILSTRQLAGLVANPKVRTPSVWLIDAIVSPMLVSPMFSRSFWRSKSDVKIIVPKALWKQLDEDARGVLLLHEWTHLRRRDWIVRIVEVVSMITFWWHPLVWIAKRQIEDCEETCCDLAAACGHQESRRVYAEAILKTLDFLCEPFERNLREVESRPLASGVGRLPKIEHRLRQIIQGNVDANIGRAGWLLIAVMTGALVLSPSMNWSRSAVVTGQRDAGNLAGEVLNAMSVVDPDDPPRRASTNHD